MFVFCYNSFLPAGIICNGAVVLQQWGHKLAEDQINESFIPYFVKQVSGARECVTSQQMWTQVNYKTSQ